MKNFALAFFSSVATLAVAQAPSNIPTNVKANNLTQFINNGDIKGDDLFFGIPLPPGKVIGDTYVDSNWNKGSVILTQADARLEGHPLRFDIKNNEIEINSPYGIKVINGNRIKSFTLIDSVSGTQRTFVNGKSFKGEDETPFAGFFEVLAPGKTSLLKKTQLVVRKANYNVQLNVGNRDDQILKQESLFIAFGLKAIEVPSGKKKAFQLFDNHADQIKKFCKEKSLNISKPEDLIQAVVFYNTLI